MRIVFDTVTKLSTKKAKQVVMSYVGHSVVGKRAKWTRHIHKNMPARLREVVTRACRECGQNSKRVPKLDEIVEKKGRKYNMNE